MKTRVITAVIALIVFIPFILYGGLPLTIFAMALSLIAMSELLVMKKMFLTSFAAILSFLGVLVVAMPSSWVAWMPDQLGRMSLLKIQGY